MATTGKYHDGFKFHGANYTRGEYVSTIQNMGIRRTPYEESSVYKRVGKEDSVAELLTYITTYSADLPYARIIEDQKKIADVMWKGVWGDPKRMKNIGRIIVNQATEKGGRMIDWLLTQRGGREKSPDIAAETITKDIIDHFKNGVTFKTNLSLDHFLVDYDMMEFLTKKAGFTSWNDFTDAEKRICYKSYPNKVLPDWNKLVRESYMK
jgi:hypothetical protein